jgi:hypothetical protein
MFTIDEILVESKVADVHFACELAHCKGACCTLKGGRGAPVTNMEIEEIHKAFPVVKKYLPQEHRAWIDRHGLVDGFSGYYATQCADEHACVFVHYESGIAKCSFETAYHKKELTWRKPLSCHLFPLRMSHGTAKEMRFEYLSECEPAFEKGSREGIPLYKFLREVLIRAFGEKWYKQFTMECGHRSYVPERGD